MSFETLVKFAIEQYDNDAYVRAFRGEDKRSYPTKNEIAEVLGFARRYIINSWNYHHPTALKGAIEDVTSMTPKMIVEALKHPRVACLDPRCCG